MKKKKPLRARDIDKYVYKKNSESSLATIFTLATPIWFYNGSHGTKLKEKQSKRLDACHGENCLTEYVQSIQNGPTIIWRKNMK